MTVAELIAERLATGLVHPGDGTPSQPQMTIALPAFRSAGMPTELKKQVDLTTKLIGEAIVHLIETEGDHVLVQRAEFDALRAAANGSAP